MRKLACKTLMEILPGDVANNISQEIADKKLSIDFETVETQVVFNEKRKIDAIVPVARNDAHKIIEECMLCANVATADFLQKSVLEALFRVHEGPKPAKLENLRVYLSEMGLWLDGGDKPSPKHFQELMLKIKDRDFLFIPFF